MEKIERIFIIIASIMIASVFIISNIISIMNKEDKPIERITEPIEVVNTDSIINIKDSIILSQKLRIKMLQ